MIQGEGGLAAMTPEFARALNETCARTGAILIADEVQTGLARTGTFYASEGVGLQPDIITLAKPLAGGLPLSAVLIPRKVNCLIHAGRPWHDIRRRPGHHGCGGEGLGDRERTGVRAAASRKPAQRAGGQGLRTSRPRTRTRWVSSAAGVSCAGSNISAER